jgi:peptidoglycan/xylan/chitin deacetylase (PgdA/CDA1 family)
MAKRLNPSTRVCVAALRTTLAALAVLFCFSQTISAQDATTPFPWPAGKRAAVSLTFDDGRASQVDVGVPLFERLGGKVTFYVNPGAVERKLDGWKKAAAAGHEIGNHSLNHPCSGNFPFARSRALEEYTLEKMRHEITEGARRIKELLGVNPKSFAYPCGQTFVGRGRDLKSYVPLVAELQQSGRLWLSEGPTDPAFADMAQLTGMETDGKEFEDLKTILENAKKTGMWVVFAGHDIGEGGRQTTRVGTLENLVPYALDPANGLWLAPVGEVASYVLRKR